MPIYRRRTRRPLRRRPRRNLRRMRMTRKRTQSRIHSFKRTAILTPIGLSDSAVKDCLQFKLSDLDDYSDFTNLFDQYRINAVKISFVPNFSNSALEYAANSAGLHSIHTVIDHNDNTDPNDVLELMQYDNYRRKRIDRVMTRYFKVNTLADTKPSGLSAEWKKWISTSSTDVAYYGLKYWIDALESSTVTAVFDVFVTYYIQCRSVK